MEKFDFKIFESGSQGRFSPDFSEIWRVVFHECFRPYFSVFLSGSKFYYYLHLKRFPTVYYISNLNKGKPSFQSQEVERKAESSLEFGENGSRPSEDIFSYFSSSFFVILDSKGI